MIVSNIKGGLCNQMFQIAAGYAHAQRCGTFFGINYDMQHNCIQGHPPTKYRDTLYKNILTTDGVPETVYHEPKFEYVPIPETTKDMLIDGYFQPEDYYERALKKFSMEKMAGDSIFILCTDDIQSVNAEFNLDKLGFIWSNAKSELEDLYIMSQCDSVIMSNSSFAWWGAYLGKRKEKVIAPGIWFGPDGPQDYHDIYLKWWEKI